MSRIAYKSQVSDSGPADTTNIGFEKFDLSEIEQSIVKRFEHQANRFPDRTAVISRAICLSFHELNESANKLAHGLINRALPVDEPIAFLLPQGIDAIVATLAILKAGHFYTALNPRHSADDISSTLNASSASLVVTNKIGAGILHSSKGLSTAIVTIQEESLSGSIETPPIRSYPDDLAYIYFTSGSTGVPKGVVDNHRNVLHNVMRYTNSLRITPDDRLSLLQVPSFSGTVSSLFTSLLNGACVVPVDMANETPHSIAKLIREKAITVYHSVPSIFRSIVSSSDQTFSDVRVVRLEGDQALVSDADLFKAHFPHKSTLVNGLGTTETGLIAQFFSDTTRMSNSGSLPVGYATSGMDVLVLDKSGNELPRGTIGEIGIRSRFLSPGYWRMPSKTESAFSTDSSSGLRLYHTGDLGRMSEDGCLQHLGRIDSHLKIRGQWVDTSRVDELLRELPSVSDSVVTTQLVRGTKKLIAYLVIHGDEEPSVETIRIHLAPSLPRFMIPVAFITIPEIPLSRDGKVDLKALPEPTFDRPLLETEMIVPRTELERRLANMWEDVLQISPIGINDDFLDLGGDSLLVLTLADKIQNKMGVDVSKSILASSATIQELAARLRHQNAEYYSSLTESIRANESSRLYFLHGDYLTGGLYCRRVSKEINDDTSIFFAHPKGIDEHELPVSYSEMARAHIAELKSLQPHGPYYLGGHCNGGLVAFEMARILLSDGDSVGLLAIVAASAKNARFTRMRTIITSITSRTGLSQSTNERLFLRARGLWLQFGIVRWSKHFRNPLSAVRRFPSFLKSILETNEPEPERNSNLMSQSSPLPETVEHISMLRERYYRIDDLYVPAFLDETVTLFWPDDDPETAENAKNEWQKVCTNVDVRRLPGTHETCRTDFAESYGTGLLDVLEHATSRAT